MPYRWSDTAAETKLTLWQHRSLTPEGFVGFMSATLVMIALPLLMVLGSPVLWGLLPFFVLAIWGLWAAIARNRRDTSLTETLTLWPERIELVRTSPRRSEQRWEANPYWVRVVMHATGGPVENYLTLTGGDREVELGAFLSPDERSALRDDLDRMLARLTHRI